MDKAKLSFRGMPSIAGMLAAGMLAFGACAPAWAALTDLATSPLATSSGTAVRPNILFTLDNSGSMAWDFLPDYTGGGMGSSYNHCKPTTQCTNGLPPFQANLYNGLAYNPGTTYSPPVNFDGTSKPSQNLINTAGWTAVKIDGYGVQSTGTTNFATGYPTTGYPETQYCNGTQCKRNGVDNNNPFFLDPTGTGNPNNYAYPGMDYSSGVGPYYMTGPAPTPPPVYLGYMNPPSVATATLFTGALNNASPLTTTITLGGPTVSLSGTVVTLKYTSIVSQTPPPPPTVAVAVGDTIAVSGSNCGAAYTTTGATVTSIGAGKLTYNSPSGSGTSKTNCGNAVVKHITPQTAPPPSISSNNVTVTVVLNSLVDSTGHALVAGDVIQVSGTGCDAGYRAANAAVTSVNAGANTFTYAAQAVLGVATNTACTISRLVVTAPASPGISINGNVVQVTVNGCCNTTGAPNNSADNIVRTGDFVWAICPLTTAYQTGQPVPVTVLDGNNFTYSGTPGGSTIPSPPFPPFPWCEFIKTTYATPPALISFSTATTVNGNPYEFTILPVEFCDSPYLTNCVASAAPTGTFTYPAPVRFCSSAAIAALPPGAAGAQSGATGTITCQGLFSTGGGTNFTSVRYGMFYRVDVVPGRVYGNEVLNAAFQANGVPIMFSGVTAVDRTSRIDCLAAPNCTYQEEMTNFANWYAYYRTRIQMMKSSAGKAFLPMDTRYRIGFATINESWVVPTATTGGQWLPVATFDLTQKQKWYNAMYSISPNNSTPLREAVARAGRYFAGLHGLPGDPVTAMADDPMEYSCQQNFLLITTDGYWNGTSSNVKDLSGTAQINNVDNNPANPATTRAEGVYDGGIAGASTTLADTAAYYYLNDLRTAALGNCFSGSTTAPGSPLCTTPAVTPDPLDNVPAGARDPVAGGLMWQHMVTFSLGLANGLMLYQPNYETASVGDVANIKSGAMNCSFSGTGFCNWPLPVSNMPTALDDLWHAAVNGRGTFYNARDPVSLSKGLSGALSGINVQIGSAAASATSSPNITQTDRSIFSSTYRTLKWDGEVVAQLLDPTTGTVPPATLTPLTPPISSIILSGTTVAVTMTNHGLITGDLIQAANTATGTCDPAFNTGGQSMAVTVIDPNNFTYPSANPAGATLNTGCQIFKAGIAWSAQTQLDLRVKAAGADPEILTRFIYTDDTAQVMPYLTGQTGLKDFRYVNLPPVDQALFDFQCTSSTGVVIMSQCTPTNLGLLGSPAITSGNSGQNLVNYLRGNQTLEQTAPNPVYRPRDHFLGDTVNARPAYVRAPQFAFTDNVTPTYATFQSSMQTRLATIYVAANEGMLHAFDAGQCTSSTSCTTGSGNERWAYIPHEALQNMYKLADVNYSTNHQYYVDGSPEVMDIFVNAAYKARSGLAIGWHTILVGGMNGGGRAYYALDITDPAVPIGLWDICSNSTQCTNVDTDLGYSYGNPVITKRSSDGNWVVLVASGYNNVSPGTGQGFLYVIDAITGTVLQKIPTNSGTTTSPSGLAKIAAWSDNSTQNNTARFVYGGDLNGDVWRFDLGAQMSTLTDTTPVAVPSVPLLSATPAKHFTTLYSDAAGTLPQPITTRPELGDPWPTSGSINSIQGSGKPAIFIGTGRYLGVTDLANTQVQTLYALKDDFGIGIPTGPGVPAVPNPRSLPVGTVQPMVVQTINPATGASSNLPVDWTNKEGWYADFPATGERNNLDPQLLLGTLIVITNVPAAGGACVTGGTSFMYQFNFKNGNSLPGAVARTALGNAISVGFVAVRLPSGQLKVIVTNASGQKSSQAVNVSGTATTRNVSWRELMQ